MYRWFCCEDKNNADAANLLNEKRCVRRELMVVPETSDIRMILGYDQVSDCLICVHAIFSAVISRADITVIIFIVKILTRDYWFYFKY